MPNTLTVWITTNWKILKEMGIPDHLTCLLKICMHVKKQQLELDMEQQTGSKLGKEYIKAVYCHPAYNINIQLYFKEAEKRKLQLKNRYKRVSCQRQ